jgi:hypothetical protein
MDFLDRWSLVHACFWFAIGAAMVLFKMPGYLRWALILSAVVSWELTEAWLEQSRFLPDAESLLNRWISDPVVSVLAAFLGSRWVS